MGMPEFFTVYYVSLFVCMLLNLTAVSEAAPQNALITSLPGFRSDFPSKHYSGYITIEGTNGGKQKHLFYYFVESERSPSNDPLVLWLNGGPGCSSFDGFVYEHGPFNFRAAKTQGRLPKLYFNPYSWSKVSNIIYLDSPAGVGLSYSYNETAYTIGDLQTASDSHAFLLKWFMQYPEFLQNEFYLAGESYAGIYVPTLADEVVKGIRLEIAPTINFKGYLIGNGLVGNESWDDVSKLAFAHGMALITDELYENVSACLGSSSLKCNISWEQYGECVWKLNPYNILEPCYLGNRRISGHESHVPSASQHMTNPVDRTSTVYCTNDEVARAWLNDESLRKAIHAESVSVTGPWSLCMDINYTTDTGSMVDYHKKLTTQGYRALIYSGDHDMNVPYTGTQGWTRSLQYKIIDIWRPWMVNNQVAGFLQGYDNNLTFLTIKGSGHQVPTSKPQEALEFYSRWLEGENI